MPTLLMCPQRSDLESLIRFHGVPEGFLPGALMLVIFWMMTVRRLGTDPTTRGRLSYEALRVGGAMLISCDAPGRLTGISLGTERGGRRSNGHHAPAGLRDHRGPRRPVSRLSEYAQAGAKRVAAARKASSLPSRPSSLGSSRSRRRRVATWADRLPWLVLYACLFLFGVCLRKLGLSHRSAVGLIKGLGALVFYGVMFRPFHRLAQAIKRWRRRSAGAAWCARTLRRFASLLWMSLACASYGWLAWIGEWTLWQWLAGVATALALALLHWVRALAASASARIELRRRLSLLAWPGRSATNPQAGHRKPRSGGARRERNVRRGAMAAVFAVLTASIAWVGCAQWDPWQTLATLLLLANGGLLAALAVLLLPASNRAR